MTTRIGAAINSITTTANAIMESSFPDEATVKRPAAHTTVSAYGSIPTASYSDVVTSIGCSWGPLSPTAASEYIRAGQINEVCNYKISMASAIGSTAIDIKPRDRVVVAARGIEPARTFEVKGIIRNAGLPLEILVTLEDQ